MYQFPKDPRKIRERIKRYERALLKEQDQFGIIGDGYGKRYLLGPLYMIAGDVEGAISSFEWFEKTFPDDIGDPIQYLCWALALHRTGQERAASDKLLQTMLMNLYLIPHILGLNPKTLDIWHGSNFEEIECLYYYSPEVFQIWDERDLEWASKLYNSQRFNNIRERYIEIHKQLKNEPVGIKRTRLVEEASRLQHLEFDEDHL